MTRKYDNSRRRAAAENRQLRAALSERSSRTAKTPDERRREKRLRLLPEDRVCPGCGEVKLSSRQWVTNEYVHPTAVCLSCVRAGRDLDVYCDTSDEDT